MSHVCQIAIQIKDLDALQAACQSLGLEFVTGQSTYKWYMEHVGDFPLPDGFTAEDLGHCQHAIRIPGNDDAYEIGVVKRRDGKPGFTLLWDFWNGGYGLQEKVGQNANKLKQNYAAEVATRQAKREGYRVTREVKPDGRILLRASK